MELELKMLWAALVAYVVSGCVAVIGVVLKKKKYETPFQLFLWLALILHTVAIGLRWTRLGYGPFISMFDILSSNVLSLLFFYALAYWRFRPIRPTSAFVLPVMFIMMAWLVVIGPVDGRLPPTYDTIWLYIHIGFGKIFMGAALVALGMALVILSRRFNVGSSYFKSLPDDKSLDELSYRFMALGFIFDALMLVAGGIWAQDAWGRYWAWDPLETWSFITWLTLAFALHTRITLKPSPPVGAVLIVLVFVLGYLTFFGIPFITQSPHKGVI